MCGSVGGGCRQDMDERDMASLKLTRLQLKHWNMGMRQVIAAQQEANADGKVSL